MEGWHPGLRDLVWKNDSDLQKLSDPLTCLDWTTCRYSAFGQKLNRVPLNYYDLWENCGEPCSELYFFKIKALKEGRTGFWTADDFQNTFFLYLLLPFLSVFLLYFFNFSCISFHFSIQPKCVILVCLPPCSIRNKNFLRRHFELTWEDSQHKDYCKDPHDDHKLGHLEYH